MGALEEISEKLDSTKSKKNILRNTIFNLVTDWRELEKDWEVTKKSFQNYVSEHRNGDGDASSPEETHLAMKEKELKEREVLLGELSAKLESDREELATLEKLALGRLAEVGITEERLMVRERRVEEREKAFEIREKESASKGKKVNDGISLEVELDGVDVHILLNGLKIDLNSPDQVSKALRLSGAPAFLVLSAMKVLCPPYLMKVGMRFEGSVGKTCILLLEQLIVISPTIGSQLREDALKLATEWKDQISSGNTFEVLALLYFLASFDLAASFDTDEVMKLFEIVDVSGHAQIPDLCHRLGLKDIMSVSKSNIIQDKKENPNCPGFEAQGHVELAHPSKTDSGTSEPMAIIIANMDADSLFYFLNSHLDDHPFLQNEVLVALEISHDSAKLVLDVAECFCKSYPQEHGSRSCILLLHQLMRISPLDLKDVQETAKGIALDWKAKIIAESENAFANLVFLVFVTAFRLVSAFDTDQLLQLYKTVLVHKPLSIPEAIYGVVRSQLEGQQTSDISPITGVQLFGSNVNMGSSESRIPMFLKHSSDTAELVLNALYHNNFHNSKEKNISVVKSVYDLLKQLASVSPKIGPCTGKKASKFALEWKSTLTDSNSWEIFAFLLFVAVYGLFSSLGANYVLGLLEVHSQVVKETSDLIRMLKLEHKATGFIMNLVKNRHRRAAFDYVYEFNLVDKIPPVALLKKCVLDSKLAAMKCKKEQCGEAQAVDGAISDEISTLEDVIKCILDHSLELEYSPDMLRNRIKCLEAERENLKPAENQQLGQEHTRKRPDSASMKDAEPSPSKKPRHY